MHTHRRSRVSDGRSRSYRARPAWRVPTAHPSISTISTRPCNRRSASTRTSAAKPARPSCGPIRAKCRSSSGTRRRARTTRAGPSASRSASRPARTPPPSCFASSAASRWRSTWRCIAVSASSARRRRHGEPGTAGRHRAAAAISARREGAPRQEDRRHGETHALLRDEFACEPLGDDAVFPGLGRGSRVPHPRRTATALDTFLPAEETPRRSCRQMAADGPLEPCGGGRAGCALLQARLGSGSRASSAAATPCPADACIACRCTPGRTSPLHPVLAWLRVFRRSRRSWPSSISRRRRRGRCSPAARRPVRRRIRAPPRLTPERQKELTRRRSRGWSCVWRAARDPVRARGSPLGGPDHR